MDQLAWAHPKVRLRRVQMLRDALRAMHLDHVRHIPFAPFTSRIHYEHEPPSHKFTFKMDGFGWADRRRAARRMQILLDTLTKWHLDHFLHFPKTPTLYQSGVVYQREPPGREDWQDIFTTLRRGEGDCEDLATWLAADRLRMGIPARAVGRPRPMLIPCPEGAVACHEPEKGTMWHIIVRRLNGRIEDPSLKLGMEGEA